MKAAEEHIEYDRTTKEKIRRPVDSPTSQGFKLYKKNSGTGDIKTTILGNQFDSFTDLFNKAEEKRTENSILAQALSGLFEKPMVGIHGYVDVDDLRLRNGAGTDFTIKGVVHDGDKFQILEVVTTDELIWYKVKMTSGPLSGKDGYIASKYTRLE